MSEDDIKAEEAKKVLMDQWQRMMNPTWMDLAWRLLANLMKLVVQYVAIGAALRFGWKLIG